MQPGLAEVLASLRVHRDVDLRGYVTDVLERRLQERLTSTHAPSISAYLERLESDGSEVEALLSTLHIGTTGFFRDPATFSNLEQHVLPKLASSSSSALRAWVPGCSTGEDAWTLASCFETVLADSSTVLGSDIDNGRLAIARRGLYGAAQASSLPAHHVRCFDVVVEHLQPIEYLRLRTSFVHHDMTVGPIAPVEAVVASFQIILVRNVLLYLKADRRRHTLARLHRALVPGGALIVGCAETVSSPGFAPWPQTSPEARIFQKVPS